MTRFRQRKPAPKPPVPGKRRPARRRGRALAAVLLVALVALAWWRWGGSWNPRREEPKAADVAGYLRLASEAEARNDYEAAFALYREGLVRFPDDVLLLGFYGTAITNSSYAVRASRGRLVPVMATSRDRVRAAHEALSLLDRAQAAAPRMPAPALQKGLIYAAWGLPEDALVELYGAVVRGDRSAALDQTAGAITLLQLGRGDSLGVGQKGSPASR